MTEKDLAEIMVNHNNTIKETIEAIDKGRKQIALVVDKNRKLLGTVTDGDIRRGILKGIDLNKSVDKIMNINYIALNKDTSKRKIKKVFQENKMIHQIPLLDSKNRVIDLVLFDEILEERKKDNYVILMAGGLGTRLRPLTEDTPKPMLTVGNKPILEIIIDQFKEYGYYNILIAVNYKREIIESYFGDGSKFGVNIDYIRENKRLGTAGALKLAEDKLNREPIFVMNGDILTEVNFRSFMAFHQSNEFDLTMATRKYEYQSPYGVVNIDEAKVMSLEEKPSYYYFINAGIYCLNPDMIKYIPENEFFDITDVINSALNDGNNVGSFPIREYWIDIGQKKDYYQANEDYNLNY
ncbi:MULTISPECIES: nucleotidyltransferase family protein [unclassified Candidatus Frackibacter]|uniref:nucleotidyltransferase family protein n=1 Tax=unclassified Candidatus Frackibacter TaxID=2648818 RepID=UPI0008830413|nr:MULTISPECIES: nucleotidyltransferase family protein [unclassified Candidatus Frackibacter]SDC72862.1 CBS domain-containing protein [Candidatus Frackibacter sp. WG11]SEM87142.1 CBS domain-containing protein [Candidatus Frackibacter sp. WG12]SFL96185.1 CBS domain-containing protein [Candidatus Frackibacter sp. WG13]